MSQEHETAAAVDLGSNSFHMIIARIVGDELEILDRLREPVRLAAGLDARGDISEEARARALVCLQRFGERLRALPSSHVRIVGTNTLRKARNGAAFREQAAQALGHPVEVITGTEEARLIYLGVTRSHAPAKRRRLVVDIGGGSTEIIVGSQLDVLRVHSLFMGCVNFSERFFPEGDITRDAFKRAEVAARLELRSIAKPVKELRWKRALGASGTVAAIASMLRESEGAGAGITLAGLKQLRRTMIEQKKAESLDIPGLKPERRPVIAGGLAILIAIFRALDVENLEVAAGALREGVLYDLTGRLRRHDARDRTIQRFVERYNVDLAHAESIEASALALLDQVEEDWNLTGTLPRQLLGWAARLREIGLVVSHTGYHKHSAYLTDNSDMPGFARDDKQLLAAVIRAHRRSFSSSAFAGLEKKRAELAQRVCLLLRLACRLNRSRSAEEVAEVRLRVKGKRLRLGFPEGWLDEHPLMRADLELESEFLKESGIDLEVTESAMRER